MDLVKVGLLAGILLAIPLGKARAELLRNADFAHGVDAWTSWTSADGPFEAVGVQVDGRDAAYLEMLPDPLPEWGRPMSSVSQYAPAAAGDILELGVTLKASDARNGWGVMGTVEFVDAAGEGIATSRAGFLADGRWQTRTLRVEAPAGTQRVRVAVELQGQGRVWVDAIRLRRVGAAVQGAPEQTVHIRYDDAPVDAPFLGLGWEDDGFMYSPVQASKGVTPADLALRERRIRWLDPDIVRMQCWYGGWWGGGSAPEQYDFDSPYMQSFRRTLALYQEIGASVIITHVTWGVPVYDTPEQTATAIGELIEELVERRGFSCIRYWTLDNEPDITVLNEGNYAFDTLVTMHQLVRKEFARRGLDIQVIGSDDAMKIGLFERCVQEPAYDETVDVYSSHIYLQPHERVGIPDLIRRRLELLHGRRPLILAEFGFQDGQSSAFTAPFMDTFDYAFYAADLCIQALNRGVSGLSIWTVQEMYYHGRDTEGRLMHYGLWAFKDRDWMVKPVYQAQGMFTRLTEPGDAVYPGHSTAPHWVRSVRVGDSLFLVNEAGQEAEVAIDGLAVDELRVYSETTEFTDAECGARVQPDRGVFVLPARGFACAVLANGRGRAPGSGAQP